MLFRSIKVMTTDVGDRNVLEAMLEGGYVLGGEQSGHIIFLEHNSTGDGLITALQLISTMVHSEKPLSELAGVMQKYPQVLVNVRVADKHALEGNDIISEAIKTAELKLGDSGRVLVRPSGTEPLVRVMVEAADVDEADALAHRLADIISSELN